MTLSSFVLIPLVKSTVSFLADLIPRIRETFAIQTTHPSNFEIKSWLFDISKSRNFFKKDVRERNNRSCSSSILLFVFLLFIWRCQNNALLPLQTYQEKENVYHSIKAPLHIYEKLLLRLLLCSDWKYEDKRISEISASAKCDLPITYKQSYARFFMSPSINLLALIWG